VQELDQNDPLILFEESIKSEATKNMYRFHLKKFFDFVGSNQDPLFENNPRAIEQKIIEFIISMKQQESKGYFSIHNHISPVLAFYKINDIVLNTSKIKRYFPSKKRANRDRAYTHEEIHKLLDIADERIRAVILILASSGMRIGAIPSLRLRNLEKVKLGYHYDQYIYKFTMYENEQEEYYTFCTPECAAAIDLYLDMRTRYGEKLNKDSFLIREQFDIRDQFAIKKPISRPLQGASLSYKIKDIAIRAGLRIQEELDIKIPGSIRKEVPIAHGFRKFFTTQLIESDLKTELRWLLEGHNLKANDSNYIRTTEKRLQQEYEKAIDNLTIDPSNRLKRTIEILKIEKSELEMLTADVAELKRMMKNKHGRIKS
jgi:integrase